MKRRLAGGVPAADDHYVAASQSNCFSGRGAVVDSGANELLDPRSFKSPVVDASGDDTGLDFDLRTAGQFDSERASIGWGSGYELRSDQDLRAEPGCLGMDARREFRSADPLREARVVLDTSACASLTARRDRFDDDRAQSF